MTPDEQEKAAAALAFLTQAEALALTGQTFQDDKSWQVLNHDFTLPVVERLVWAYNDRILTRLNDTRVIGEQDRRRQMPIRAAVLQQRLSLNGPTLRSCLELTASGLHSRQDLGELILVVQGRYGEAIRQQSLRRERPVQRRLPAAAEFFWAHELIETLTHLTTLLPARLLDGEPAPALQAAYERFRQLLSPYDQRVLQRNPWSSAP